MKHAQFEILGLAIVVIIISVGVFFLLALTIGEEQSDPAGQFFNEQFAQNTLDAFLSATHPEPGCERYDVKEYYYFLVTQTGSATCSNPETADELAGVLAQAIDDYQGMDYLFEVRENVCPTALGDSNCNKIIEEGLCTPATVDVGRPGRQTASKYPLSGEIEFVLWLCSP